MTIVELNEHIRTGWIEEIIRVAEAKQRKELSKIADDICSRDSRLVLLAGGSSSGKTTTAKRLATQIRVNEHEVINLSTDDYFVGDEKNPRDENGKLDYEHVECVDIPRLSADINSLLEGEPIPERRFDFVRHVPAYTERVLQLAPGGMVVLEGIHALNPRLSEGVPDGVKYRIGIDPKPSIDLMGGIMMSSADARLLRRMVRDHQFRKIDPKATLDMWPNVLKGEQKWIEPFRKFADATFDSYLVYELAVLKFYVGGLLAMVEHQCGQLPLVMNMERVLHHITPIDATKVPGDSILRETIGGSQLEY